jgi:putative (di)nucleoside polyphosphate hydrolase
VIDSQGYRANVGIILARDDGQLFWARRYQQNAWQFPQGGINPGETVEQALYRELMEEVGLGPRHVELLAGSKNWLRYDLPSHLVRHDSKPVCIGQKQRWFLLRFLADEKDVCLDGCDGRPEFDGWRWVSYWQPLQEVIEFKRDVYKAALSEFAPLLAPAGAAG